MRMLGRKIDIINSNFELFSQMVQVGMISTTTFEHYRIYTYFANLKGMGKMDAYTITSESLGVSEKTVMNAVKSMTEIIQKPCKSKR